MHALPTGGPDRAAVCLDVLPVVISGRGGHTNTTERTKEMQGSSMYRNALSDAPLKVHTEQTEKIVSKRYVFP